MQHGLSGKVGSEAEARKERTVPKCPRSQLQKARAQVDEFLQRHGIHSDSYDVNVAKVPFGGLYQTYPLHLAAMERDWHMVRLLLHFGANQRDSRGRTPYDCMGAICPFG